MKLHSYLSTHGLTETAFAALAGVSQSTVNRWKTGELAPSRFSLRKIVEITRGAVTPNDFLDMSPAFAVPPDAVMSLKHGENG